MTSGGGEAAPAGIGAGGSAGSMGYKQEEIVESLSGMLTESHTSS